MARLFASLRRTLRMVVPSALLEFIPQLQLLRLLQPLQPLQLPINHLRLLMVQLSSQSLPCPWLHRLTALLHMPIHTVVHTTILPAVFIPMDSTTSTLRPILVTIPTLAVPLTDTTASSTVQVAGSPVTAQSYYGYGYPGYQYSPQAYWGMDWSSYPSCRSTICFASPIFTSLLYLSTDCF